MITHDEVFTIRNIIRSEGVQPTAPEFIFDVWLFVSVPIDKQIPIPDFNRISR